MRHVLLAQWFIIAILAALIIAPFATAQPSNGSWELVEDSADRKVFERIVTPTPEPTATATLEPTATATDAPVPTATPGAYQIVYSLASHRSNPVPLAGATVSGKIYAFVPHDPLMDAVTFYLNGELVRVEANSPYDFGGGSSSTASSWDTATVASGPHVIRAVIQFDDGTTAETSASFTVANGDSATATPTATAGPTATSGPTATTTPVVTPEPGGLTLIPTFRSISVYAPSGSAAVEYRVAGGVWRAGHPLHVDGGEARGSLVGLEPDTEYEVRVGGETATVRTRAEASPASTGRVVTVDTAVALQDALNNAQAGDTIALASGIYVGPFTLTADGTADNPITIDGQGAAVLSGNAGAVRNILTLDNADYVRLTGLTIRDAGYNLLVLINGADHAVIEDNQFIEPAYGHDTDLSDVAAAIHFRDQSGWAVIRNNTFHRETVMTSKHSFPALFTWKAGEGLIVTGNTVTGGFEDAFRWGPEDSTTDSKSRDIDIYDNVIDGACFDDGIQPEGIAVNVRIWGNRISHCYVSIALAPSIEGPVYVFRNIITDNVHPIRGGSGIFKLGDESEGRRGPKYIYHNTFIANAPVGEVTVYKQTNSGLGNVIARNNIAIGSKYIAELGCDLTCDMDYDAVWTDDSSRFIEYRSQKFWNLSTWCATYQNGCHGIAYDARADLDAGYAPSGQLLDAGVFLPGFSDGYRGNAPDIGAVEGG